MLKEVLLILLAASVLVAGVYALAWALAFIPTSLALLVVMLLILVVMLAIGYRRWYSLH